jgi:hypothetical protein
LPLAGRDEGGARPLWRVALPFALGAAVVGAIAVVAALNARRQSPPPRSRALASNEAPVPLRTRPAPTVAASGAGAAHGEFLGRVASRTTGAPVANAQLVFSRAGTVETITTDAHGRFDFRPSASGTYELTQLSADGYLGFATDRDVGPKLLTATADVRLDDLVFLLDPAHEVIAQVLAPGGRSVEGARVRVFHDNYAPVPPPSQFVSDASGEVRFPASADVMLEVVHSDWAPARLSIDVTAWERARMTIQLAARQHGAGEIRGVVLDGAGAPVEGALVTAERDQGTMHWVAVQATTGADGVFVLDGIDDAAYVVRATASVLTPSFVENVKAGAELTLRVGRGGIIRGVVRDAASGRPVTSFEVMAHGTEVNSYQREGHFAASVISADGRFELDGVPPGTYEVWVSANGSLPPKTPRVTVRAPDDVATIEVALSPGALVRGRVIDAATGQPIEHARVRFNAATADDPTLTDRDGRFELAGYGRGRRVIAVSEASHNTRIIGVDEGDRSITVELTAVHAGEMRHNETAGVGIFIDPTPAGLVVTGLVPGGPAAEAQMQKGDIIVAIDGRDIVGADWNAHELLLGEPGTDVRVGVKRGGDSVELTVHRRLVVHTN